MYAINDILFGSSQKEGAASFCGYYQCWGCDNPCRIVGDRINNTININVEKATIIPKNSSLKVDADRSLGSLFTINTCKDMSIRRQAVFERYN